MKLSLLDILLCSETDKFDNASVTGLKKKTGNVQL